MLNLLYRIEVKFTWWYIMVFRYVIDIAKVNTRLLYHRHQKQISVSVKKQKALVDFLKEIVQVLTLTKTLLNDQIKKIALKRISVRYSGDAYSFKYGMQSSIWGK